MLAVPNGGVAVAEPLARQLGAVLKLLVVRKIQIPGNPEAGFGAVGAGGGRVLDQGLLAILGLSPAQVEAQSAKARESVRRRLAEYGEWARLPPLTGRTLLLVDDGLASGSTMAAAVELVRAEKPARVVVAAPTASARAVSRLKPLVDQLLTPHVEEGPSFAVASAYENWYDVSREEVSAILTSLPKLQTGT
ncbi:MAG: phosphoribosyltransferase [Deltaproteobacteria bacterium]|nr:phosphoribosyltransferase [Deltaproteobacteria bacterium]